MSIHSRKKGILLYQETLGGKKYLISKQKLFETIHINILSVYHRANKERAGIYQLKDKKKYDLSLLPLIFKFQSLTLFGTSNIT